MQDSEDEKAWRFESSDTFSWTVLQCRRMCAAVPKRLLQCGHWWSRRLSCTTLQWFTMSLFAAKRLLQWGHL